MSKNNILHGFLGSLPQHYDVPDADPMLPRATGLLTPDPESTTSSNHANSKKTRVKYGLAEPLSKARRESPIEHEKLYAFPEAGCIYVKTDGFEELKQRPCDGCMVEFLKISPGEALSLADGLGETRHPYSNHVVLQLQIKGEPIEVTVQTKAVLAQAVRCSPEIARAPSMRTYLAAKPLPYSGPSRSATAAFWFEVADGATVKDFLDIADPPGNKSQGLFPFTYVDARPLYGVPNTQVGCRDFLTQWFCLLHSSGLINWQCHQAWYPGRGVCKPDAGQTFPSIMQHVYNSVLVGGKPEPNLQRLPIPKAHFETHKRRLEYAGEELHYQADEQSAVADKDATVHVVENPRKKRRRR